MAQSLAQFGQTIKAKHPEYADIPDEELANKVLAKYPQYRDMVEAPVAGAGPLGTPQPKNPTVQMEKPLGGSIPQIASDIATGALKGAGRTANNIGKVLIPDAAVRAVGATVPQGQPSILQPTNTAQKIGGGIEQAGEFMLPGSAEEAAAAKLAPYVGKALPVVKAGLAALGSGAVNKAQGGSFTSGAIAGGVSSGAAQGLKAVAPAIAESALNIRKLDRAYKEPQAIGRAILDKTTGFSPSAVADSAQGRLNVLNPQLDAAADAASVNSPAATLLNGAIGNPNPSVRNVASLAPARQILQTATDKAVKQGERTAFNQVQPMATHLNETMFNQPIPADVTPRQLLDLKRGFGNEYITRWNPETLTGVKGTAAQTYHALGQEFNRVVPRAEGMNSEISTLIPIAKRAESAELNAPTTQRVFQRIAAPTGALAGAIGGGAAGYEHGGRTGAIEGIGAGLLAPALLTTPTGEMVLARSLNRLTVPAMRPLVGSILQMSDRKNTTANAVPQ